MLPEKGIKLMIIGVLLASLLMPFSVSADTISSSNIVGIERTIETYELYNETSDYSFYTVTFNNRVLFDKDYLGWVNMEVTVPYYYSTKTNSSYSSEIKYQTSGSRTFYVNGNSLNISVPIVTRRASGMPQQSIQDANLVSTYTLNSSNVTEMASLQSLNDIINILNDVYNSQDQVEGLINNQLIELQNIVSNTSLANDYLEGISKIIQWNIPIESLNACSLWLNKKFDEDGSVELLSFYLNAYREYPIFKLNDYTIDQVIFYNNVTPDNPVTIIMLSPQLSSSQYSNYIDISGSTISNISTSTVKSSFNMAYPDDPNGVNHAWYFRRIDITTSSRGVVTVKFKKNGIYFVPIFVGTKTNQKNISTEFALNWGLSNELLDNLNIIAQGTTQSNQSASDLQGNTSDFETTADQYYTIENTYNNDMNTQLQNIDTSTGLSGFGGNFLTSANWVRVQYQNLTNGNPFGSLVTYGLTLGLALLLLGKVFL